jgi:hypothetical protein
VKKSRKNVTGRAGFLFGKEATMKAAVFLPSKDFRRLEPGTGLVIPIDFH